jgi:hypothetical protein
MPHNFEQPSAGHTIPRFMRQWSFSRGSESELAITTENCIARWRNPEWARRNLLADSLQTCIRFASRLTMISPVETRVQAQECVEMAHDIAALLQGIDTIEGRQKIIAGIEAYRRKIGRA